jgi:hypothetical protein
MPTLLQMYGLNIVIYPSDHRPAHVHVMGGGCEVVFNLNCPNGPPELRENHGFSLKEIRRIAIALSDQLGFLCKRWRDIHGDY